MIYLEVVYIKLEEEHLVEKRNVLNELRCNDMTLQELRFFSIYLSKINSRDLNTRVVRFSLKDFQSIMELGRLNLNQVKESLHHLLRKIIDVPVESNYNKKINGAFKSYHLFKECEVNQDNEGNWYVEIDADDKALELMFNFKEKYFKYQLWNILSLKSANQFKMYEILKQYENIGERIIEISQLKILLGFNNDEYKRYTDFKDRVLIPCQKALQENTDIKFEFESYGRKGRGGKILKLKFSITKNDNYKNALTLKEFVESNMTDIEINTQKAQEHYSKLEELERKFKNKNLFFYSEACEHEFDEKELQVLYNMVLKIVPDRSGPNMQIEYYDYLKSKYDELNLKASKKPIINRYGYIKKLIELDLEE